MAAESTERINPSYQGDQHKPDAPWMPDTPKGPATPEAPVDNGCDPCIIGWSIMLVSDAHLVVPVAVGVGG